MTPWHRITKSELEALIADQLLACPPEIRSVFDRYRIPMAQAPIWRFNTWESVFIVAQKDREVMYYEDVEEGFNFSSLSNEGTILQRGCNQDDLNIALLYWADRQKS